MSKRADALAEIGHPNHDVPDEREPPQAPVEPDEGPIPPFIPDDPEHDRLGDPAAVRPQAGPRRTTVPGSTPGLDAGLRAPRVAGPGGKPPSVG